MPASKEQRDSPTVLPAPKLGAGLAVLPTEKTASSRYTESPRSQQEVPPALLPPASGQFENQLNTLAERRARGYFAENIEQNLKFREHDVVDSRLVNAELRAMTRERVLSEKNNFIIFGATKEEVTVAAAAAERRLVEIFQEWGQTVPTLRPPIIVGVRSGEKLGAGGGTTFYFRQDRPVEFGAMYVQGEKSTIESTIGHEITHVLLAKHFNAKLPRWADEGAAVLSESVAEQEKYYERLISYLQTGRGMTFEKLFTIKEYGEDDNVLYAESRSAVEYLVKAGDAMQRAGTSGANGRERFIAFISDIVHGEAAGKSTAEATQHAISKYYDEPTMLSLQKHWNEWVLAGSRVATEGDIYISGRYGAR